MSNQSLMADDELAQIEMNNNDGAAEEESAERSEARHIRVARQLNNAAIMSRADEIYLQRENEAFDVKPIFASIALWLVLFIGCLITLLVFRGYTRMNCNTKWGLFAWAGILSCIFAAPPVLFRWGISWLLHVKIDRQQQAKMHKFLVWAHWCLPPILAMIIPLCSLAFSTICGVPNHY